MPEIARMIAANEAYALTHTAIDDARPARRLAIVTCMDARIDVYALLGLELGDAHIIRNAGGRVSDDVLRSLALSVNILEVNTVVLMQHTGCGIEGTTDEELRERCGADVEFLPIDDHVATLQKDIDILTATPFLKPVHAISGLVYDLSSGRVDRVVHWERS